METEVGHAAALRGGSNAKRAYMRFVPSFRQVRADGGLDDLARIARGILVSPEEG